MSNEKETRRILDKTIKDSQAVIDKAKAKLKKLEVTYSIGDRFKGDISGNELLLVGSYQEGLKAGLAYLYDGEIVCKMVGVSDLRAITQTEMAEILSKRDIKRTFDYRKQVNV